MTISPSKLRINLKPFLALFTLEVSLLFLILSGYRRNFKPDLMSFFASPAGWIFLGATFACVFSTVIATHQFRAVDVKVGRSTVVYNLLLLVAVVGISETILRQLTIRDLKGEYIGRFVLRPRGWDAVTQRYSAMVDRFESKPTFFVTDPHLGWTVGKSRQREDHLSFSSIEGIRSLSPGRSYAQDRTPCRIAIVGDSFAFADEVRYEDSWGSYLESQLGQGCQVLNFAVGGYNLGQMYLRFKRDVLPWRPDVVISGFTDGALLRTMGVYCFLVIAGWECPWAQPRFVLKEGKLSILNFPLPQPREIYSARSIRDLAYIEYDRWYSPSAWEQPGWDIAYISYGFRLLTSVHPHYDPVPTAVSDDEVHAVNAALFHDFVNLALSNGVVPFFLYLPQWHEFRAQKPVTYSHGVAQQAGVELLDATSCLEKLDETQRFISHGHYAPKGNQAVAACLLPHVREALTKKASHTRAEKGNGWLSQPPHQTRRKS